MEQRVAAEVVVEVLVPAGASDAEADAIVEAVTLRLPGAARRIARTAAARARPPS